MSYKLIGHHNTTTYFQTIVELVDYLEKTFVLDVSKYAQRHLERLYVGDSYESIFQNFTIYKIREIKSYDTERVELPLEYQKKLDWACNIQGEEMMSFVRDYLGDDSITQVLCKYNGDETDEIYIGWKRDSASITHYWHKVIWEN